jgi:invasion protein IalB
MKESSMELIKRAGVALVAVMTSMTVTLAQETPDSPNTFGRWSLACAQPAQEGASPLCELRQAVGNQQGQEIVRIAFGSAGENGREIALRTPQGVFLPAPVELAPLEAEALISVPYRTCLNQVCIARGLVQDERLDLLVEAQQPSVRFRDRSGRVIRIIVDLEGLSEGLEALDAR